MQREIVRVGDLHVHGAVPPCCPFWPTALPCASTFSYTLLRSMSRATMILLTDPWFEYAVGGILAALRLAPAATSCVGVALCEDVLGGAAPAGLFEGTCPN